MKAPACARSASAVIVAVRISPPGGAIIMVPAPISASPPGPLTVTPSPFSTKTLTTPSPLTERTEEPAPIRIVSPPI